MIAAEVLAAAALVRDFNEKLAAKDHEIELLKRAVIYQSQLIERLKKCISDSKEEKR